MSGHTPSLADVLELYLAQDRAQFHVAERLAKIMRDPG